MPVSFTEEELICLEDRDYLITKNEVSTKMESLLKSCITEIRKILVSDYPSIDAKYGNISPKVSRGENYNGLPYFVLDYPRYFQNDATFSYRIICLWGKYFTFNLYLAGNTKNKVNLKKWDENAGNFIDCFISVSNDPWIHYLEHPDYVQASKISALEIRNLIEKIGYFKISKKTEFKTWSQLPILAQEYLKLFINL